MTASQRKWLQRALPIVVSAGVLMWLFARVDPAEIVAAVNTRVVTVMLPAMLAFGVVTLWIEALSIRGLVPDPPPDLDLWAAARIKCASYLPGIIHYTLGIGGLTVLLRRRTGLSLAESASLVLLISSSDLLMVLTGASVGAAFTGLGEEAPRLGWVLLVIGGFFGGLFVLRTSTNLGPLERLRQLAIFEGLRRLPLPRLGKLLALRAAFSVCFVAGCASAFFAFEIPAPPALMISGILLVALVSALPIAVAGLGTSQAAFVYLFEGLAPPEKLLAMSLVLSFGILSLRASMGLLFARELTREALQETQA